MRVVLGTELVFEQVEVPTGLFHRLLGFAARDRGAQRVHALGFREHVLVGLDFAFVRVDLRDVLAIFAERAVETVALVAVPVDEQHHLPPLGALFTPSRKHPSLILHRVVKGVRNGSAADSKPDVPYR